MKLSNKKRKGICRTISKAELSVERCLEGMEKARRMLSDGEDALVAVKTLSDALHELTNIPPLLGFAEEEGW